MTFKKIKTFLTDFQQRVRDKSSIVISASTVPYETVRLL